MFYEFRQYTDVSKYCISCIEIVGLLDGGNLSYGTMKTRDRLNIKTFQVWEFPYKVNTVVDDENIANSQDRQTCNWMVPSEKQHV